MTRSINWPQAAVIIAGLLVGGALAFKGVSIPGWLVAPMALIFGPMGVFRSFLVPDATNAGSDPDVVRSGVPNAKP